MFYMEKFPIILLGAVFVVIKAGLTQDDILDPENTKNNGHGI